MRKHFSSNLFIYITAIIYIISIIIYFCNFNQGLSSDNAKWGAFGDFLGGTLSPILGIISIILTYRIINSQNIESKQSEFKYMFQILFDSYDEKLNHIEITSFKRQIKGKNAIDRMNKNILNLYSSLKKTKQNNENLSNFRDAFWSVYEDANGTSATYMKNIHNCLKIIDNHCIENKKTDYSDLLRAQFSYPELVFILFNSISNDDFNDFKIRIEKYSFIKDLKDNTEIPNEIMTFINKTAFDDKLRT